MTLALRWRQVLSDHQKSPRDIECRRRPSARLKREILDSQNGCCLACGATLTDVEYDHVIPLALGGGNDLKNWAAVCPPCHRTKTRIDLKRIAKAKRQRRFHETGRSRAPSKFMPISGSGYRGFDNTKRRHMNGNVSNRCSCPKCRPRGGA